MATEIAQLGFSHVELSHGIRMVLVPGILRAVEEGVIRVASVHNFCPLPPGVTQAAPNLFEPSARDSRERDQWLRYTRRTIEFAGQLKASVVVCHLGSVGFFWSNPAARLRNFIDAQGEGGGFSHPELSSRVQRVLTQVQSRAAAYWKRVVQGVKAVEALAREKRVQLGFENRERLEELPLDTEFARLFEELGPGAPSGYWHDTGHAEIKQRLGVRDQAVQICDNAAHLLGFHLHDVDAAGKDHRALGDGTVNFESVSSFWKPEHVLVLELAPDVDVSGVHHSKREIEALVAARGLVLQP